MKAAETSDEVSGRVRLLHAVEMFQEIAQKASIIYDLF